MHQDPLSKFSPEIVETVRNLRLLDDDLMTVVFEDKGCVELTLQIIMDKPDLKVTDCKTQVSLKNIHGKSARFDVWATDNSGTQYNIEIQRADKGAGCKRARYNSAMLDANITEPGDDCDKLPQTYVIFITEHDVLGKNQLCYRVERTYRNESTGQHEKFGDETHIIYVNAAYEDDSSALGKLMEDFRARNSENMYFEPLKTQVYAHKELPKGVERMYKTVEELQKKAAEAALTQGRNEGAIKDIISLVEDGLLTVPQAAERLHLSACQVEEYLKGRKTVS